MSTVGGALHSAMKILGTTAAAVVDLGTGATLGIAGDPRLQRDLSPGADGAVFRASMDTVSAFGADEHLEEVVISSETYFHVLRLIPEPGGDPVFIHLALDRSRANLAMARLELRSIAERRLAAAAPAPGAEGSSQDAAARDTRPTGPASTTDAPGAAGPPDEGVTGPGLPRRRPQETLTDGRRASGDVRFSGEGAAELGRVQSRSSDAPTLTRLAEALRQL